MPRVFEGPPRREHKGNPKEPLKILKVVLGRGKEADDIREAVQLRAKAMHMNVSEYMLMKAFQETPAKKWEPPKPTITTTIAPVRPQIEKKFIQQVKKQSYYIDDNDDDAPAPPPDLIPPPLSKPL